MKANQTSIQLMWVAGLTLALSLAPAASRAAEADKPDSFPAVAPYIGPDAIGVARADLTRVDPKALEGWLADLAKTTGLGAAESKELTAGIAQARPAMEAWLDAFRKAGGREVYVVFDPAELTTAPPVLLVPVDAKADHAALGRLLVPGGPAPANAPAAGQPHNYGFANDYRAERIGDVVAAGTDRALKRMREARGNAAGRPDLAKALAAAGDGPIQAAVAPSADARRVVEELLPRLPAEVGGGPGSVLTRGVRWASLSVRPPPQPSLRLIIQAQDADSANALSDVITKAVDFAAKELQASEQYQRNMLGQPPPPGGDAAAIVKALAALNPKPAGDRLELALDAAALDRMAAAVLTGPVERQRTVAKRLVSANNIKQLVLACLIWAEDHKGEWPDRLEDAAKKADVGPNLMTNPARPGTGYTYVKPPARTKKSSSEVVVIYEAEASPLSRGNKGLNVGFMDGHVEFMGEEGLRAKLKEQAGEGK